MNAVTLPTRPLGTSGMEITTVGLGTWAIGGGGWSYGWGPQDDDQSLATMRRAVELGMNWFDTAGVYGHGHSEEVVGRFLEQVPDDLRPLVFTKCGPTWDAHDHFKPAPSDLSPANVRRQCDDSLRRLGVERLDLLQFHWPDEGGVEIEESWAVMADLVADGKVRAAGVSNFGVRRLMIRLPAGLPCDRRRFDAFSIPNSMVWIADKQGKEGILKIEPFGS